jgi:hypothetical protein
MANWGTLPNEMHRLVEGDGGGSVRHRSLRGKTGAKEKTCEHSTKNVFGEGDMAHVSPFGMEDKRK